MQINDELVSCKLYRNYIKSVIQVPNNNTDSNSNSRVEMALISLLPLVTWLAMGYSAIKPGASTTNQVSTCDPADCASQSYYDIFSTCRCDDIGWDCICSWNVWFYILISLGVLVVLSGTIRYMVRLCRRRDYQIMLW